MLIGPGEMTIWVKLSKSEMVEIVLHLKSPSYETASTYLVPFAPCRAPVGMSTSKSQIAMDIIADILRA